MAAAWPLVETLTPVSRSGTNGTDDNRSATLATRPPGPTYNRAVLTVLEWEPPPESAPQRTIRRAYLRQFDTLISAVEEVIESHCSGHSGWGTGTILPWSLLQICRAAGVCPPACRAGEVHDQLLMLQAPFTRAAPWELEGQRWNTPAPGRWVVSSAAR